MRDLVWSEKDSRGVDRLCMRKVTLLGLLLRKKPVETTYIRKDGGDWFTDDSAMRKIKGWELADVNESWDSHHCLGYKLRNVLKDAANLRRS